MVTGTQDGERLPDALVVVVDAANLDNHLRFTLQLIALGLPVVVALNMFDLAERDGLILDPERLARDLGVPVVPTVAVRRRGLDDLKARLGDVLAHGGRQAIAAERRQRAGRYRDPAAPRARNRGRGHRFRNADAPLEPYARCGRAASDRRADPAVRPCSS